MKIDLTKQEYKSLLRATDIANFVYGIMGDMVDEKYKKPSKKTDELTNKVLEYADQFGQTEFVEEFEGKNILSDDYSNEILKDVTEFEEYVFWDRLVQKLALKEMQKKYSLKERKQMDDMERITIISELEEKYFSIFEKDGIDNFELKI